MTDEPISEWSLSRIQAELGLMSAQLEWYSVRMCEIVSRLDYFKKSSKPDG